MGASGVCAAVDDIHHGHGQCIGIAAANVLVQRQVEIVGCGLGHSKADAEDGVSAEFALGFGAVESYHSFVNLDLVKSRHTYESFGDRTVDIGHGFEDTFAHISIFVAVAQLESFVNAGGGA